MIFNDVVAAGVLIFMSIGLGVVFTLYRRVSGHSAEALAQIPAKRLYWLAAILMTGAAALGGLLTIQTILQAPEDIVARLSHALVALALWLLAALFIPFFIVYRSSQPRLALAALVGGAVSLSLATHLTQYRTYMDLMGMLPVELPLVVGMLVYLGCLGLLLLVLRWLQRAEREMW
ncbi:MAG: hypothetical protein HPY76_01920 [Anaerolineae bacterium]|nr:hypothetical protein [Anaerolineae bacterium]